MTIHKKFACSIVGLACGLIMWQAMKNSCPPKERHLQAVTDVVERTVDRIFEERIQFPEQSKELAEYLSTNIVPQAVERLTADRIDFTDYGVFSLGKYESDDGEKTPVSIGLFGTVFTVTDDQAYNYINGLIGETEIEDIINNLNNQNNGNENIESNEG